MYHKAYGIIETLAPLHVGASAGEETGNLNLIFRDQFTQTGIIPGSSIRGRFRADMRQSNQGAENTWYGHEAVKGEADLTSEALVKFEYASIVWLPVYCPSQPIVWVSCPRLLTRYQKISGKPKHRFKPYTYFGVKEVSKLFFNLGFIHLQSADPDLKHYIPDGLDELAAGEQLVVVVDDCEMPIIHDMALYRQSRVSLEKTEKKAKKGAFFDVEALPEGTILAFLLALRETGQEKDSWQAYLPDSGFEKSKELFLGGLESIGFGRTQISLNLYHKEVQS